MTQHSRIISFKYWMLACMLCVFLFVLYVELILSGKIPDKCTEVVTSEGVRILQHNEKACAPLQDGETDDDIGRRYVQCKDGVMSEELCHPFLRYDTMKEKCTWSHLATCQLKGNKSKAFAMEELSMGIKISASATFEKPPLTHHHPPSMLQLPPTNNEISHTNNQMSAINIYIPSINKRITPITRQIPSAAHQIASTSHQIPPTTQKIPPTTHQIQPTIHQIPPTTPKVPSIRPQMLTTTRQLSPTLHQVPPTTHQVRLTTSYMSSTIRQTTNTSLPVTPSRKKPTVKHNKLSALFQKSNPSQGELCSDKNCKLPNCFCYGSLPNVSISDTPQFIMITFDDSVTSQMYQDYYQNLFVDNKYQIFNPSGCPLKGTFYVSIENSDLQKVMNLWYAGNEIGSHTIHHLLPEGDNESDYTQAAQEIDGMRQELLKVLKNQDVVYSVKGFRSPFLKVAGNIQFDVLRDFNFLYDTSFTSTQIRKGQRPIWPFTLDHILIGKCINTPCPTKAYPGLWEVIMNAWVRDDGNSCSMMDSCISPSRATSANQTDWENVMNQHFEYFYKYKVPMSFFAHASLFRRSPASYSALINWLQQVTMEHPDVWVVTPQQVIKWMRNPMTNKQMTIQQWGC